MENCAYLRKNPGYAPELQTDINVPPLKIDEDKNFRVPSVLDFRKQ